MTDTGPSESAYSHKENTYRTRQFGFWIYLMTDCVLFATLFATFIVLRNNTHDGPSGKDIFELPYVFAQTVLLLTSSLTSGIMLVAARKNNMALTRIMLAATIMLGASFLVLEVNEFHKLASEGFSWHRSAFLSAFFTLVGTHGAHIMTGLLWALVLGIRIIKNRHLTHHTKHHLTLFVLFWHFLDLIWIFVFTIVYLMGVQS